MLGEPGFRLGSVLHPDKSCRVTPDREGSTTAARMQGGDSPGWWPIHPGSLTAGIARTASQLTAGPDEKSP